MALEGWYVGKSARPGVTSVDALWWGGRQLVRRPQGVRHGPGEPILSTARITAPYPSPAKELLSPRVLTKTEEAAGSLVAQSVGPCPRSQQDSASHRLQWGSDATPDLVSV